MPVLERLAGAAGLDRHREGRGGAARARARRRARQRRHGAARRPGAGRGRRRRGRLPLPDAHARRAADDAGRPALRRRRRRRSTAFLEERLAFAVAAGIPEERICLDPGIGFGKTVEQNLELCAGSTCCSRSAGRSSSGSRARARSAGSSATRRRGPGRSRPSLGAAVAAYERGASIFRVHDVREHVEALRVAGAVA